MAGLRRGSRGQLTSRQPGNRSGRKAPLRLDKSCVTNSRPMIRQYVMSPLVRTPGRRQPVPSLAGRITRPRRAAAPTRRDASDVRFAARQDRARPSRGSLLEPTYHGSGTPKYPLYSYIGRTAAVICRSGVGAKPADRTRIGVRRRRDRRINRPSRAALRSGSWQPAVQPRRTRTAPVVRFPRRSTRYSPCSRSASTGTASCSVTFSLLR
jgi:hypothetical protein